MLVRLSRSRFHHTHGADVAVVTGLYLASYRLGSALGQTLAGAVWTQRMPVELLNRIGNETIAQATYNAPYATIELYPMGTPERAGMVESYAAVQRILASTSALTAIVNDQSSVSAFVFPLFAGLCYCEMPSLATRSRSRMRKSSQRSTRLVGRGGGDDVSRREGYLWAIVSQLVRFLEEKK